MEFEEWFEELLDRAAERSDYTRQLVLQAPFMYEDFYEEGLTPLEALVIEWGE